jgi:hypothetical protein
LQGLLRRFRFTLQMDVRKFFPSLDHAILKGLFRARLADERFLDLLDRIVDGSNPQEPVAAYFPGDDLFEPFVRRRGLPIGNLTSQWFANWFLDELDHRITRFWKIGGYLRYCDDFVLLDNDAGRLREMKAAIPEYLTTLRLQIHQERLAVLPAKAGRVFVGYRTWPSHTLLKAANKRRFIRRCTRDSTITDSV